MPDRRDTDESLYGTGRRRQASGRRRRRLRVWEWGGLAVFVLLAGIAMIGLRYGDPAFPKLGGQGGIGVKPVSLAIVTRFDGPPARVTGGDTLKVDGERIRLFGIDAPEGAQTCADAAGREWACGAEAAAHLRRLVGAADGRVSCVIEMRDGDGVAVSTCTAGGLDLGAAMVEAGLALTCPQYPAYYAGEEAEAKRRQAGLWAGKFEAPWTWREARGE